MTSISNTQIPSPGHKFYHLFHLENGFPGSWHSSGTSKSEITQFEKCFFFVNQHRNLSPAEILKMSSFSNWLSPRPSKSEITRISEMLNFRQATSKSVAIRIWKTGDSKSKNPGIWVFAERLKNAIFEIPRLLKIIYSRRHQTTNSTSDAKFLRDGESLKMAEFAFVIKNREKLIFVHPCEIQSATPIAVAIF